MFFRKKKQESFSKGNWLRGDFHNQDILVQMSGRLDHTLKNDLSKALQPLLKRRIPGAIVLQLSNVHFLDTTIAATLAAFFRQAERRNVPVEIWDASPVVKKVFVGMGLEKLLSET